MSGSRSAVPSGSYGSHVDFYRDVYGHAIRELRPAGRVGASLMAIEQDAGDWSDAPSPDLVINVLTQHSVNAEVDLGAGRFQERNWPGSFAVVPPHVATTFLVDGFHSLRTLAIPYGNLLELAGGEAGLPDDGDFGRIHAGMHRRPELVRVVDRLWSEARDGHPHGALGADGLLLQLAAELLRMRDGADRQQRGGLAPWQARRVTEFMIENMHRDISLSEIASLSRLSPHHFCRAFKTSFGVSPTRWLLQRRIERAEQLMLDPSASLIGVALAVGYESQGAFGTAFRRVTGTTPAAWRRDRLG